MNFLAILVEFLGTFIFLSVIVATGNPWAIGATLAVLIFFGAPVSNAHYNPAVTVMSLFNKGISIEIAIGYILAQLAGGIGAVVVYNRLNARA
jgi:glycerol uptake facilitator-like aquaporin